MKSAEAFQRYDANGDGVIDFTELGALMRGLAGSAAEWEDCQIRALLKAMDSNNDGKASDSRKSREAKERRRIHQIENERRLCARELGSFEGH